MILFFRYVEEVLLYCRLASLVSILLVHIYILVCPSRSEYVFNFDNAFELHNDVDVLKKMGLDCGLHSGTCTAEDIKQAKSMLPKAFESTLNGEH